MVGGLAWWDDLLRLQRESQRVSDLPDTPRHEPERLKVEFGGGRELPPALALECFCLQVPQRTSPEAEAQ